MFLQENEYDETINQFILLEQELIPSFQNSRDTVPFTNTV